ncbi:hypothetical protein [Deinococcus humi]|uniref:Uncharacterized protein n=1 Tax=Deinococcus humi TaxID=662880 RepID=A0A7W8ND03_9DEIO|nr:hypothetical protein [Deinococcus humi]MBB5361861.1 hypothetical protein [Deinococcus humi]GGO23270.1 hypothetical protein GCM10008949_11340 [Deinococcus humi]
MGEGKPESSQTAHPAQEGHSPQGGVKDTNDLSDIKDVQKTGMQEKAKQVENLPESVIGTDTLKNPNQRS